MSRLATPDWELEWNLPRWQAEPFALPEDVVGRLVVANALGLVYVRLIDDGRDGETAGLGIADMRRLANVLYDAAIATYFEWIGPRAWFGSQVERFLDQWRAVGPEHVSFDVLHSNAGEMQRLAHLGSPLHIATAAVCAISGREAHLAEMMGPVRHYLIASVLLDHMADWREDMQAGRPNLFVRALLDGQPSGWLTPPARLRFYEAFLRSRPAEDYLNLVDSHFHIALSLSRRQSTPGLTQYLELRQEGARQAAEDLVRAIEFMRHEAVEILFHGSTA